MWQKFRKELEKDKKTRPWFHRNFEYDFALKYLADLRYINFTGLSVLDVGCCESLFMFELDYRGYETQGIDTRVYEHKLPRDIIFHQADITNPHFLTIFKDIKFQYITAISTIEHIGLSVYGNQKIENGDRLAMENLNKVISDSGYLIMTVPNSRWGTDSGRGYTPKEFSNLVGGLFDIFEISNGGGQICAALVKH